MKRLLIVLIILICLSGCGKIKDKLDKVIPVPQKEEKKLQIIDLDSKSRPFAVMIDNHKDALPHYGVQDAYLVYEIIVEGGITRLVAFFKDVNTETIGPVRSARHYYIDYTLENNAIYAHFGWSPQAQSDIKKLNIDNINGLYDNAYWRDKNRYSPHNAFTSIAKLKASAEKYKYELEGTDTVLLKYNVEEVSLTGNDAVIANNILIDYSGYQKTGYEYDSINKNYKRISNGNKYIDKAIDKEYTVKNIIIIQVKNYSLDNSGRQELENIGSGKGYFITNGYAKPITWEKSSRSAKTIYKYSDGKEIVLNDGNAFIQIQPLNRNLEIN